MFYFISQNRKESEQKTAESGQNESQQLKLQNWNASERKESEWNQS